MGRGAASAHNAPLLQYRPVDGVNEASVARVFLDQERLLLLTHTSHAIQQHNVLLSLQPAPSVVGIVAAIVLIITVAVIGIVISQALLCPLTSSSPA